MSIENNIGIKGDDCKFGLPKSDFQALPKRKPYKFILGIVISIVMIIAGKQIYTSYGHKFGRTFMKSRLASIFLYQNKSATLAQDPTAVDATGDGSLNDGEVLTRTKDPKKEENINAVQKKLEEGRINPRPLVKPGTYQELRLPQGIYHLVVVSHLDKQSALKVVRQLMQKSWGVYLILPKKGEKYYRVTIGHSKTKAEAEEKLKQLKPSYPNMFVVRY